MTVSFTCADTGSVQSSIDINTVAGDNQTLTAETSGTHVTSNGDCIDKAGNADSSATFGPVKIDKTAPVIPDEGPTTSPNGNGWYNTDVTNEFSLDAGISGPYAACALAFPGDAQSKTTSGEGLAVSVTSDACTDLAGNTAPGVPSADFQIDQTAPVIIGLASPGANANGWNNTNVIGDLHAAPTSGSVQSGIDVDTVAADNQTLTAETTGSNVSSDGDCIDKAGNSDSFASVGPIKIDKTAPVISSSAANADASPYVAGTWTNQSVTVSFTCADTGSVQSTIDVNTVAADNQTLTAETSGTNVTSNGDCIDKAGNADSSATFGPVQDRQDRAGHHRRRPDDRRQRQRLVQHQRHQRVQPSTPTSPGPTRPARPGLPGQTPRPRRRAVRAPPSRSPPIPAPTSPATPRAA